MDACRRCCFCCLPPLLLAPSPPLLPLLAGSLPGLRVSVHPSFTSLHLLFCSALHNTSCRPCVGEMALRVDGDGGVALTIVSISAPDSPVSLLRDYAEHCIASGQTAGGAAMPRRRMQPLSPSGSCSSAAQAAQSPLLCGLPRCAPALPPVLPCVLYLFCLLLPLLDAALPFPFISLTASAASLSAAQETAGAEEGWTSPHSVVCSRYTLPMLALSGLFSPLHGLCLTVALWLRLLSWSIAAAAMLGMLWAARELTCGASRTSHSKWRWQTAARCCCYAAFGLVTLLSSTSRRRGEDIKRRR